MSRKRNPSRGPSLEEIAARAGVSLATASRVLGSSDYQVSPATRRKVIQAANELNYLAAPQPAPVNIEASPVIAVIVPTLQNPFFSQVILGIESGASKRGYQVMVSSSHRSVSEERKNINSLLRTRITALIIISIDTEPDTLENYIACGGKVALLDGNFTIPRTIAARTDYLSAGKLAANYLISCGHKSIAFLSSPLNKAERLNILMGICSAARKAGLTFSDSSLFIAEEEEETDTGLYEFESGIQLAESFLRKPRRFTAIIAINDLMAFGIIQALTRHGLSVPEDISVIGFDNLPYSGMIYPPLTTIELPSVNLGTAACNMLIDTLSRSDDSLHSITFDFQGRLIERESVRRLRN